MRPPPHTVLVAPCTIVSQHKQSMEESGLLLPANDASRWDEVENSNDGHLDLDQWDYLTRTYDRVDFFHENSGHYPGREPHRTRLQECSANEDQFWFHDKHVVGVADDLCLIEPKAGTAAPLEHGTVSASYGKGPLRAQAASASLNHDEYGSFPGGTDVHKIRVSRYSSQSIPTGARQAGGVPLDFCTNTSSRTNDLGMSQQHPRTHETSISQWILSRSRSQQPRPNGNLYDQSAVKPGHASTRNIATIHIENFTAAPHMVPQSPMNLSPSRSSLVTTGLSRNSAGLEQVPFQSNSGHNQASAFQFNSSYTSAVQSQNEGTAQLVQWSSAPQQQNPSVHVPDAAVVLMLAPLSAYNYFYRNERDMIVNGMTSATDPLPPSDFDFTPRKMAELLHQHWYVDPLKKRRRHRKAHGFIAFATLSKEIARRWKTLPKHGRDFYREVAKADQQRHDGYLAALRRQGYDGSLLAMPV